MNAVELILEKVKALSENEAQELLAWLDRLHKGDEKSYTGPSARRARGFARRYRNQPRSTSDWMKELREGER